MKTPSDEFLSYYLEELTYLRKSGAQFARAYPKVAARLELHPDECPDPHVERLIESFAFLTARIQSDLDQDFSEIAAEMLNVVYPHYLNPIPSMSVARFEVDPKRAKMTTGHVIDRDTMLFTTSTDGAVCRMRTAYPVTLWPVEVTEVAIEANEAYAFIDVTKVAAVLRLRLRAFDDPFNVLGVDKLRFYLNGDSVLVSRLYAMLADTTLNVAVLPIGAKRPTALGRNAIAPIGFGEDEALIPYPRYSHPSYRLLQEYFAFPEKFCFFDVSGLAGAATGKEIDLLFYLGARPPKMLVTPDAFALGCTPVVNVFRKTSEPIRIDHRQLEYPLVADYRRQKTTEIHSIVAVSGSADPKEGTREYAPFYCYNHGLERRDQQAYWHARRVLSQGPDYAGTEIRLSFRDSAFNPARPPEDFVYAHLLCTNRGLATELPAGVALFSDEAVPVASIVCMKKPTPPIDPPLGGQMLWRLVSHLSLNHLSLTDDERGIKAFREIVGLYANSASAAVRRQIDGIDSVHQRRVVRRIHDDAWRGFCRGTEITLTFDESNFVGGSAFLFASVIQQFLSLYTSINSFTELVIKRVHDEEEWKRWPPSLGGKPVL